jgi:putative hydrolase of the HAD superfamily
MPSIRAIYFDAVGTLLFPEPDAPAIYSSFARRYGLERSPSEVRARFLAAYRAEEAADRLQGWITNEAREHARWHRIVTETLAGVTDPEACFRELFVHFSRPSAWRVSPDAGAVITTLRTRGFILGLGSNYDARLLTVLDGFPDLGSLRERLVISATLGHRKPAPEFFHAVARSAGCDPDEILFVGDDVDNDYVGATNARLCAILLAPEGAQSPGRKSIQSLRELIA